MVFSSVDQATDPQPEFSGCLYLVQVHRHDVRSNIRRHGDSNQNGNDARFARGLSRFHTPHRFTLNGTYRLPFFKDGKGLLGHAFGGWQFSGVVKLAKGTPFTVITTGVDLNFDGFAESRPVLLNPAVLGAAVNNPATSQQVLPATAFRTLSTSDSTGNLVGRNTFFMDGVKNVDFGAQRSFACPGRASVLPCALISSMPLIMAVRFPQ